jgi:oxygen-dependent protoporphyrinogen oxidase
MSHVLVIGGGIAGLSAALRLRDLGGPSLRITIVEQSAVLGGKLATAQFAGMPIETGAETFLVRRPEATSLVTRLGLTDRLVNPAALPAGLSIGGELRDMPRGTVMGIPAAADSAAKILTTGGLRRLAAEPPGDAPLLDDEDISVGQLVRARYGDEITDRLVDPLLGGVYAGRADDLSLDVTIPALAAAARRHRTLREAVGDCLPPAPSGPAAPVFGSLDGGLSVLVDALAGAVNAELRLGLPVRELHRTAHGWQAVIGATRDPYTVTADAVVLAIPAAPAARLLDDAGPAAAAQIASLDYANIGLVTMALPHATLPQRSGFLVPATEGRAIKAATFFSRKWPRLGGDDLSIVRVSFGRYGDHQVLQRDDADLVDLAYRELCTVLATGLPRPVESTVRRWGGGLPQYRPGHLGRVNSARAALDQQPIALAGAAFDGVGIPACIGSGQAAAETVWQRLSLLGGPHPGGPGDTGG